jgi:hypothetical protein
MTLDRTLIIRGDWQEVVEELGYIKDTHPVVDTSVSIYQDCKPAIVRAEIELEPIEKEHDVQANPLENFNELFDDVEDD